MKKSSANKKKVWFIVIAVVSVSVISGLVFKRLGKMKTVACRTQFGECPQKYSQVLGATTDKSQLESVLIQLPDVKSVEFRNNLGTLEVIIQQRTPLGIINGLVVDDTGKLYTQVADSALPRLEVNNRYELGQEITSNELSALKTLSQAASMDLGRFSSKLVDNSLYLTLDLGAEIVINVESSNMDWSKPLQHILARSKIEGNVPRRIDLRFNNPVITF